MKHQSHPAVVKRLKRARGHLESIIAMFEAGRPCVDLAQQLHAVENAVAKAKTELIQDHIEHCLEDAVAKGAMDARRAMGEMRALSKYL
jgi:uncharacterized protein